MSVERYASDFAGSRTCFSMESIKRRSRWGRSCFGAASGFDGYWLKHQTKPCCYVMFAMPLMSRSQCILTTIKSSWRSFLKKCIWHRKHGNLNEREQRVTDRLVELAGIYLASPTAARLAELQTAAETTEK